MTVYRKKFRDELIQRVLSKNAPSQREIALETGVSQPTLSRWMRQATLRAVTDEKRPRRKERTPSEKLQIVFETAGLPEAELGTFLRERGIYESELIEWRQQALDGLADPDRKQEKRGDKQRLRELERELRRKEKALAEAAALIVLKKKVQAIWGDEADDTSPPSDDSSASSSTRPSRRGRGARRRAK